jgi:TonB-linked SusC/RagA family outer membrane protein
MNRLVVAAAAALSIAAVAPLGAVEPAPTGPHAAPVRSGSEWHSFARAGEGAVAGVFRDHGSAVVVQAGTIAGRVTESATARPLASVQVSVEGTTLGALTDQQGRYTIQGVPAGAVQLSVVLIGYGQLQRTVQVGTGETVTEDFQLTTSAVNLDEIVVTGTAGGTQRRAIGNVVETVDAASIMAVSPVANVNQLISQRVPGLITLPEAGQVGTGSPIQIRGVGSLSLSTDPIVYIDGIRMDSNPRRGTGQRGGSRVNRLNDLNPSDIESIEVIKGPAAATLYGTEASNGVIQIITKRGASGAPSFDIAVQMGTNWMWDPEERSGLRWARDPDSGELTSFNVYENERINGLGPVFDYGLTQAYDASLRGGSDAVRYYASASWNNDKGIVDWNWDKRLAVRANLDVVLTDKLTLRTSNGYTQSRTRLIQGGIDFDPFSQLIWATPATRDEPQRGWFVAPPEEWGEVEDRADNDRTTTSVELNFRPFDWTTHRLIAGLDRSEEKSWTLVPRQPEGADHFYGNDALGVKDSDRDSRQFVTVDYAGTANYDVGDFSLASSIGFQYYRQSNASTGATGEQFPAVPITTVSGGAVRSGSENFSQNATVGVYVQQQVGWNNRLFITGAVRGDDNSAFGADYDAAIYPKLSGTWVLHEEPFWPIEWVDQFRVRAAWGVAGQQPGTFDAARLYDPQIGYRDQPALEPAEFGNPQLKPERGEELEAGFDATLFSGRLDLNYTGFLRNIKDAIVNRPLPPSSGFDGSQTVNIGRVKGWGHELGVRLRVLQAPRLAWDIETQYATFGNRIEDLGGVDFIGAGGQAQHREGYAISDLFMYRILSAEIDDEGFVTEAICDGGSGPDALDPGGAAVPCSEAGKVWWGPTQPTWQLGVGTTLTLFGNLRLYGRVEGNGGHYQVNTEIRAIHNLGNSEAVLRRNDPLLQAYRSIENDATGAYEAGFLRLREISATYSVPPRFVQRFGASAGSLTVGMRNVMMLWTAAHGWGTPRDGHITVPIANMISWDPEIRGSGVRSNNFQTIMPPLASATVAIRLSF